MLRRADSSGILASVACETAVMNRRLYCQPLDYDAALSEVQANEYVLHVRNNRIAATGAWRRRDDGTAYLSTIAVRPELRRQGLACMMLLYLLGCCTDAASADLAVHPDNSAARSLYAERGYHPSKLEENVFGDDEPRLIMVRSRGP